MHLAFESATVLTQELRTRQIGSRELLELFIERIERYDPSINAVVVRDFERARKRAEEADSALKAGQIWGPLHGLPMTVKESFSVEGLPTTRGVPALKSNVAAQNMLAVDRLVEAGAIVFGKTNVPLMLGDWQTFNQVYGTTNNPWDLARTPGGSSGGSAAALAAGFTTLDIGSDIAGSIRNPAHYCGVYGHKPTHGICPTLGHELGGRIAPRDISVIGPLARSAQDLSMALAVIAGPDEVDARGWKLSLPAPRQEQLRDFRVAFVFDDDVATVDIEIKSSLQRLADFLARKGAVVADVRPQIDSADVLRCFTQLLRGASAGRMNAAEFEERLGASRRLATEDDSYAARLLRADVMHHRDWHAANETRHRMRMQWASFFAGWDVLVCPAAKSVAIPHDQHSDRATQMIDVNGHPSPSSELMFWAGYPAVSLLPATSAPVDLSARGLPIGAQIIGPQYGDLTTILFASLLEREYRGFQVPPAYAV